MLISKNTPKEALLKEVGTRCQSCGHCCSFGSGVVLESEIPEMAKQLAISEKELKEMYLEPFTKFHTIQFRFKQLRVGNAPHGRCVFLNVDSKRCHIHENKSLHCKISTCSVYGEDAQKWFDVNYFLNLKDPQSVREYNTYLKFNTPLFGAELESLLPSEELKKILSYEKVV